MTRRRVLFLTHWYPTLAKSIAGIFVREHAKAVALYDDVTVLHLAGMDANLRKIWELRAETNPDLSAGLPTYRAVHRRPHMPKTAFAYYLRSAFGSFHQLLAEGGRFDLIHAHVYEAGVPAVMLGRHYGLPVVITEHASHFPRRLLPFFQVWKARYAFGRAKVVLPVSKALQQGIEAYNIHAKFQIVPNVVDTERFRPPVSRPPSSSIRLLFVGSLLPVKGLPTLLQALALLERADWRLDIVGDGPERDRIQHLANELGIAHQIHIHGYRPKQDVAIFMQAADYFLLPSQWENAPCVIIEAMACGLPIIASRVGGIPELVGPDQGILVPPQDVNAWAMTLADVILHKPRFDRQAIAAHAQNYAPTAVGAMLHDLYQQLL